MNALMNYNIEWNSQSQHSGDSMPVGGHDIGVNIWVENGDVLFYFDRSGSFDENNQMLKLGRVRLTLTPNPFREGEAFSQKLKLHEGYVEITGETLDGLSTRVELWVDVFRPVIHLEVNSNLPVEAKIGYENWRIEERELPEDKRMPSLSARGYPGVVTTKPDIVEFGKEHVLFYHHNKNDELFFEKIVELQGLSDYKDRLWNPQINQVFGGMLWGEGMKASGVDEGVYIRTPYKSWRLVSEQPQEYHRASICFHAEQVESIDLWLNGLNELVNRIKEGDVNSWKKETRKWWTEFWSRSYIHIHPDQPNPKDQAWQAGRNYNLFRYMLGCNAYGNYPTKFNGGLFTSDPCFVTGYSDLESESPDYRHWGGGSFTAQNQRLVYWPMLKSGDFHMMKPQFDFYNRALSNAELRTKAYWGHGGCSFTEQLENFGLPIGWAWGWPDCSDELHRRFPFDDPAEQVAPWIKYQYVNQLEFSFMILKYYQYNGADISEYLPFIESSIRFFDEHYQYLYERETTKKLDENGKLVLFPSTACETYKLALNPVDLVSALTATVSAILQLPEHYMNESKKDYYKELLARIPSLSFREMNGKKTIAPAERWKGILNVEIPQLYPVFPYELFGIGREDLMVAIDTWRYGIDIPQQKNHISWHQDNIFCARLGLVEEAAEITIRKLADGTSRFPAFWGPGHDWLPDHNWGGTGMIGLQDMLMQTNGEKIYLMPAWPREWDVNFKLHAPLNTVVEGKVKAGVLIDLKVVPETRKADVINLWEDKEESN